MRGATARSINHLVALGSVSIPHITEIYISTAVSTGNVRELRRLAGLAGSDINGRDARKRAAVHIAVEEGQFEALRVL